MQADGSALIGGIYNTFNNSPRYCIVRVNSTDVEDLAFAANLGSGFDQTVTSIIVQPDGKIVAAGYFSIFNGATRWGVVRLNADGTPDTSFNSTVPSFVNYGFADAVLQSDGKIVLGGWTGSNNLVIRLNSDGTQDISFSTNQGTGFGDEIWALAVQADGKILVGGYFTAFNGNARKYLVRLNSDGTEDSSFYANLGTGFDGNLNEIVVQADGKILIGGDFTTFQGSPNVGLIRLNSDGTLDTAFSTNYANYLDGGVYHVEIQPDGKLVTGGWFTRGIARFQSTGAPDTTFNSNVGAGANPACWAVGYRGGDLILGGDFASFNGKPRNCIQKLNSSGVDTANSNFDSAFGSLFTALRPNSYSGGPNSTYTWHALQSYTSVPVPVQSTQVTTASLTIYWME